MKQKVLIDTQIFLWTFLEPKRFKLSAKTFFQESNNKEFYLSHVSSWEIAIKYGIGKLKLPKPPEELIREILFLSGYEQLPIRLHHIFGTYSLPLIHRDPFDRLLVSQAKEEKMTLLTTDKNLMKYKIDILKLSEL
ncbi:MAG: type II toxin-antitoxin system VapC family toxin [Pyrinomonadaceae bacterium]